MNKQEQFVTNVVLHHIRGCNGHFGDFSKIKIEKSVGAPTQLNFKIDMEQFKLTGQATRTLYADLIEGDLAAIGIKCCVDRIPEGKWVAYFSVDLSTAYFANAVDDFVYEVVGWEYER